MEAQICLTWGLQANHPQLNAQQRDLAQVRRRRNPHWIWLAGLGEILVQLELTRGPEVAANRAQQRGAHPTSCAPQQRFGVNSSLLAEDSRCP